MRFITVLLLALALAAPASAGWKLKSDNTGDDRTGSQLIISYKGAAKALFHNFTGTGALTDFQIGNGALVKICLNANTGGTGANGVAAQLFYFHNGDQTLSLNDASPVLNFTFTGADGEDCMYDNDPGFYRIVVTDAPDVNASYFSIVRVRKTD